MNDNQDDDPPRWEFRREFKYIFKFDTPEQYLAAEPLWSSYASRFDDLAEEAATKFRALMEEIGKATGMVKSYGIDHLKTSETERVVVDGEAINQMIGSAIDKPKH